MRIYIGESDRWKDKPLFKALVEAMRANDIAGVTVYRGILGYGAHRRAHKEKPLSLSRDASIMLSVVDTEEKLQGFMPLVEQMVEEGLVVLSDVDIVKYSHRALEIVIAGSNGRSNSRTDNSHERGDAAMKEQFQARMLRIHFGENDEWQGKPLHEAIVAKAQELGLAGANVYRGIEGYGPAPASTTPATGRSPAMRPSWSVSSIRKRRSRSSSPSGCDGGRRPDRNLQRGSHTLLKYFRADLA